ncbi:MAG: cupin domain-containing protein [Deltaproteobacteria bacterium]|nr:cupin domain-containing protein [Deltaproteobacteria bacterium]
MPNTRFSPITPLSDAPVEGAGGVAPWAATWQVLTPHMRGAGGNLGVVMQTLPAGSVGCPFHWHTREDEVFYVVAGRGILRYGDEVLHLKVGDCISCPAGQQVAHQIGNPFDEDLVYLAIGPHDPNEICGYPDTDKINVRCLSKVGRLQTSSYLEGEPEPPLIFSKKES